jgi:hypothetical protein
MKRATLVLAALALLLGGVGRARAGSIILYNNLPPAATNNRADAVFTFGPLADSFSTGGSAVNLSDVKLLLVTGTPTGSITVTLRSDSSTSPGAVLTTIGTLNDTSLTPTLTVFDFPTSYSLAANTRYWIEVSSSNSSDAFWGSAFDASGVGVANEHFSNVNGQFPSSEGPYQMELTAQTPATPAPEPSTLTLLGIGSLGLLGYVRRRKQPAA